MADDQLSPDELASQVDESNTDPEAAPDTLSPHQMAGLQATDHIEEGEMKDHLDPEELNHEHAAAIMNGTYGQTEVPLGETMGKGNTIDAAKHFYKNTDSTFRKVLYSLNLPEQFLMRQGVAAMAGMGAIDDQTTKALLGNDELSPSDVLDYYWKPSSTLGRAGRFLTGLASDIVLDPLNLIGVGEAKSVMNIAGKTVTGLEKMSEAQRAVFKTMGNIEKVITDEHKIVSATDAIGASSAFEENIKLLADARDSAQQGNPLGFMGLQNSLRLSEDSQKAAQIAMIDGLTQKSAAAQLAAGDRELTIGLRLPFTNVAIEGKIPGPISESIGKGLQAVGNPGIIGATIGGLSAGPIGAGVGGALGTAMTNFGPQGLDAMNAMADTMSGLRNMSGVDLEKQTAKLRAIAALDNTFNLGGIYAGAVGMSQEVYRKWQNLWTKTSDVFFNRGMEQAVNLKGTTANQLAQQTNKWNAGLEAVKARIGDDAFKSFSDDIVNELEKGMYTPEEAQALAEKHGRTMEDPLVKKLYMPTAEDTARMQRLAAHPEVTDMLGTMRQQLKTMVGKYDQRGMPFEELNPFGEGWMNRYLKHAYTAQWSDYMSKTTTAQDAFLESMRGSESLLGKFDESALGRKYRGGILEANEASQLASKSAANPNGIKMFVDDPIQLYNMRVQEMQDAVAKHDLIESALPGSMKNYNPGSGWMKAQPEHFGHMESLGEIGGSELTLKGDAGVSSEAKIYKSLSYVPEDLRQSFQNGDSVYFRNDVYDRMLWNTQKQGSSSGMANTVAAIDSYTWFWRNGVLASTGYLGTKFFHNMLSYYGLMGNSNPEYLYKGLSAMVHPQDAEYISKIPGTWRDGEKVLSEAPNAKPLINWPQPDEVVNGKNVQRSIGLSHEQFMDLARQHGVLGTGTEVLLNDVFDAAAGAYGRGSQAKNIINTVYGFGVYRTLAQWGDDLPKLATFAQRLEQGFTAEAAAETATKYFHNFHPVTAEQSLAKAVVPFISFPMKTAELMAGQITEGRWGELTIPGHVQKVLQGAWIEDRDLRDYLSKTLPETKNWYEPLHGGLTPGARSMSIELPWCYNTLSAMWNEDTRLHPVFQLLAGAMALKHDGNELDTITDPVTTKRVIGQNIDLALPQYVRNALTIYAINGGKFPGADYLVERYQTKAPDMSQYMDLQTGKHVFSPLMTGKITDDNPTGGPSSLQIEESALNTRFQNAADFGKWANTYLDSNWLYNLMFHGAIKAANDNPGEFADNKNAIMGEWIRQHIHDATLGLVTFDKNDQTFFSKYLAIDREIKGVKKQMFDEANKTFLLSDPKTMGSKEALQAAEAQGQPQAKRILRLMDERDALVSFQDWFLQNRKTAPDFSLHRLLFGVDQLQMSEDGKPGPQMTEALHPQDRNISDEDASRFWNEAVQKKWYGKHR